MGRTKGTYTLTSNIEPKVGAPLDARTIVKLLADLTASNTFEYPYRGMRVFVEENNKSYTLVGSDPTVSSNWTEDGSGGGHVIKNQTGTNMNQRSNLQFVDMTLSDDAINDITKVENIHVIQSESELDNLPDGLYMLDDEEDTVIDSDLVGYDNTDSGLEATNVKDAIDELAQGGGVESSKLDKKVLAWKQESTMVATRNYAKDERFYIIPTGEYAMALSPITSGTSLVKDSNYMMIDIDSAIDDLESSINSVDAAVQSKLEESTLASEYETETTMTATKAHAANSKFYISAMQQYCMATDDIAIGDTLEENTNYVAITINGFLTDMEAYLILAGQMLDTKANKSEMSVTPGTGTSADKTTIQLKSGTTATVLTAHQDISGKADKVTPATNGNLAGLNGSGNLTDSGWNGAKDTTSISGNPISIPNLKANQLALNPIITLEPIQAGSGTPSPSNIRAISGYDKVEALSCGVNVWDEQWKTGAYKTEDGTWVENTSRICSKNLIPVMPNATYFVPTISGNSICDIFYYGNNKQYVGYKTSREASNFSFTTPNDCHYINFGLWTDYGGTYNNNVSINYPATQTSYVASNKATSISESLGQTVYGLTHEVRTGKARVTRKHVKISDLTWQYWSSGGYFYTTQATDKAFGTSNVICSAYKTASNTENLTIYGHASAVNIHIRDDSYSGNVSNFVSAMGDQTICYELATPIEIQLTPHEISLLKDYAYLSTNGTNIALDYHNGELASLADVSQLGETVNRIGDNVSVLNNDVLGLQNAIIDRWHRVLPSGTLSTSITTRNQWGGIFLVVSKRPTTATGAVCAVYICSWHAGGSTTSTRIFGTEDITITGGGNTMSITYLTNQYGLDLDVYQLLYS